MKAFIRPFRGFYGLLLIPIIFVMGYLLLALEFGNKIVDELHK